MKRAAILLAVGFCLLPSSLVAQAPTPTHKEDDFGLELPTIEQGAPRPWSDKPVLNNPQSFQFAVVTDRTGGHRPGVWMHGVRDLNILRPEFVVSVGDLIEGYTTSRKVIDAQWNEFLGFIDRLDMRFFFVAGNHDVTNPRMHGVWRERFGREWYSFNYKGVHFVCLSSEDPQAQLGDDQLAWLEKDLETHSSARWTFLFMHKPLWAYSDRAVAAGNADRTNWERVDKMLGDRPYTAFAGHHHNYMQFDRRGRKLYQLATTGGGSRLRGETYGEFDHVTWVTMEDAGPRVANLRLDGVLPADVVTEEKARRFNDFLQKARLEVEPLLVEGADAVTQGAVKLTLTNELDDAIRVQARLSGFPLQGLTVTPPDITLRATPHQKTEGGSEFKLDQPAPFSKFQQATLTATIETESDPPMRAELTLPIIVDRRFPAARRTIVVDGEIDAPWKDVEAFEFPKENPTRLGGAELWKGPEDAWMQFKVAHDADHVYLLGQVTDENVIPGDGVVFVMDTRPFGKRQADSRLSRGDALRIELDARETDESPQIRAARSRGGMVSSTGVVRYRDGGYDFEISLPRDVVFQGDHDETFQLMCAVKDVDQPEDQDCYVLWRAAPDPLSRNLRFAHIFCK